MGRKRQGAELFVFMNGEKVGLLSRLSSGKLEFRYEAGWLKSKSGRPLSLSMPMAEQIYSGATVENYFDNLLPDSQPIRNRIQKRFGASSDRGTSAETASGPYSFFLKTSWSMCKGSNPNR